MHGESLTCRLRVRQVLKGASALRLYCLFGLPSFKPYDTLATPSLAAISRGCTQTSRLQLQLQLHLVSTCAKTADPWSRISSSFIACPLAALGPLKRAQDPFDQAGSYTVAAALHPQTPSNAFAQSCFTPLSRATDQSQRCAAIAAVLRVVIARYACSTRNTARPSSPSACPTTMTNSLESSRPILASVSHCVPTVCFTPPLSLGRCLRRVALLCE